jgi:hypothetical protein
MRFSRLAAVVALYGALVSGCGGGHVDPLAGATSSTSSYNQTKPRGGLQYTWRKNEYDVDPHRTRYITEECSGGNPPLVLNGAYFVANQVRVEESIPTKNYTAWTFAFSNRGDLIVVVETYVLCAT